MCSRYQTGNQTVLIRKHKCTCSCAVEWNLQLYVYLVLSTSQGSRLTVGELVYQHMHLSVPCKFSSLPFHIASIQLLQSFIFSFFFLFSFIIILYTVGLPLSRVTTSPDSQGRQAGRRVSYPTQVTHLMLKHNTSVKLRSKASGRCSP
jgi:hypothetical protein